MSPPKSVAVIGAGVVGSALAATLSRQGFVVTIIDEKRPGTEVSEASFAWVNATITKQPMSYLQLNRLGMATHHKWSNEGRAPWFRNSGCITVACSPREQIELSDVMKAHQQLNAPVRALSKTELENDHPTLGNAVLGANLYPDDGWIDPQYMIDHQLRIAAENRAEICTESAVVELREAKPGQQRACLRFADNSMREFDSIVVAAGNGSARLLRKLHPTPLLTTGTENVTVGLTIETLPLSKPVTTVMRAEGVSVRPTNSGGAVIADHPTAARYLRGDPSIWEVPPLLIERASELMPHIGGARIARARISERVMPVDGLPIVGWIAPKIYTVLTHSGVTLAPLLSENVADELRGSAVPHLTDFRPNRFVPNRF